MTPYPRATDDMTKPDLMETAGRIRLLALDVDGVLTDGAMYYGADGEALKRFHTRDAAGMALLRTAGIDVAWLTAEDSQITKARAEKLKIEHLVLGCTDKLAAAETLCGELQVTWPQVAYMGDDWFDVPLLQRVGLSACPADAHPSVRSMVTFLSALPGGQGAVRELSDLLIEARRQALGESPGNDPRD